MKSIKPGRGPSFMGGIMSIAVGIFGVFWTIMAAWMGAGPLALFGLVFIGVAVAQAVYNFKNATSENRYSEFDIVDHTEEADPLNERFGAAKTEKPVAGTDSAYCPYCGTPVQTDFEFCNKCGRKLP